MRYPELHRRRHLSRMITTVDVLGGAKVLRCKIKNSMDWHALILKGMPAGVLSRMNKEWGLTDKFMAGMIGLSAGTVSRKRKRADMSSGERLSLVQGDRLYRIARIMAFAVVVFEDKTSALKWLNSKQTGFGGRVPLDMLQTAPETVEVENMLSNLKNAALKA
jgi:putative toxin-antitoxin system antitoxin component (TIGR02293 family)